MHLSGYFSEILCGRGKGWGERKCANFISKDYSFTEVKNYSVRTPHLTPKWIQLVTVPLDHRNQWFQDQWSEINDQRQCTCLLTRTRQSLVYLLKMSHVSSCRRKIGIVSGGGKLIIWRVLRAVTDLTTRSQHSKTPNREQTWPIGSVCSSSERWGKPESAIACS